MAVRAETDSSPRTRPRTRRPERPAAQAKPREAARRAREELYREHILKAAEQVFAELGFEAAKVQDISRLAGLSMGSIYGLFPSKDALFGEIIARRGRELLDLARSVVETHDDPVAGLETLAATYTDYFYDHRDFLRMYIRTGASWALNPSYTGHQEALSEEIHELQRSIFARGVERGAFIEEDPGYLAVLLSGIDQVHLASWVAGGMQGSREQLRDRFLRIVRKTFLR
jgi:AcrR family transcriptional regulator